MVDRGGGVTASLQLAAARRGDLTAFVAILKGHDRQLRAIAWRLLGERGLMDDALQEVAIKAARALPELRDDAALAAWLRRTTYRTCLDLPRRDVRLDVRAPEDMPPGRAWPATPPTPWPTATWSRGSLTLSPDQRAAVVLVDQEGLDYAATAELLGVPAGTVASRLADRSRHARPELALARGREG